MMMTAPPMFAPAMVPAMPPPGPPAAPFYPPQYTQQPPPAAPAPAVPPMAALAYGSGSPAPEVRNVPGNYPTPPRPPVVRGVMGSEDGPRSPAPMLQPRVPAASPPPTLPNPEHLGIGVARNDAPAARGPANAAPAAPAAQAAPAASVDWNVVHTRLQEMGAISSQVRRVPEGGFRFTCLLPTGQADQARRVEADGTTEVEAARLALAQAELYCRRGK